MKRCPTCSSIYTDDTLQFCLQDGVPLENAEKGEQETVVRTSLPETPTVAFEPDHETEMMTRESAAAGTSEPARGGRTGLTVAITAFVMLVLFGVIGLSAYLYMNRQTTASNADVRASSSGNSGKRGANQVIPDRTYEPTPNPSLEETPSPDDSNTQETDEKPEPTPTDMPDPNAIENTVGESVERWKSLAESRRLGPYMDLYADRVDYYSKSDASKEFVALDKRKAFTNYSTITVRISGLDVVPSSDGKTAEAVFDKEWLFANADARQTGKVRSKLVFRNIDGVWKIVSERDIRTYYVRK